MPSRTRVSLYIAFLVSLAVWVGGGVFDSISSHPAWHANPVAHVRTVTPPPGFVNPWPFTTAVVALLTLACMAAFARYRGDGRREVLLVLAGVFAILLATGLYFVPNLIRLEGHAALSDAQITSISLSWIRLNVARIIVVLGLLVYGLVGLMRLGAARAHPVRD
jgi:hypothetical protein